MSKPNVILDPDWRRMDEVFSPDATRALFDAYDIVWGRDGKISPDVLQAGLPKAEVLISATPHVDADVLARAPKLRAVIEVSGEFPDTVDYAACEARDVEILSCAPGFRQSVAEMGLAMALGGARGLFHEHDAFRAGREAWLADNDETDFSLFGAKVGFVGFGQIAQELMRLLAPFQADVMAYDPWLPNEVAQAHGARLAPLAEVLSASRCVFVAAVPTAENQNLLNAEMLALMPDNAFLIVLSRAHLVDFEALVAQVQSGRLRAAVDVFPSEPVAQGDPIRGLRNIILSPHRAAAVQGGRQLIGDMILSDLAALFAGRAERRLGRADAAKIGALMGVSDASSVAAMAKTR